eukprot:sb/3475717/
MFHVCQLSHRAEGQTLDTRLSERLRAANGQTAQQGNLSLAKEEGSCSRSAQHGTSEPVIDRGAIDSMDWQGRELLVTTSTVTDNSGMLALWIVCNGFVYLVANRIYVKRFGYQMKQAIWQVVN